MDGMPMLASFWTGSWVSMLLMVIGFGLVIFIHELGHFLVAKWVGIKVEEFAIGFGKKLWSFRRGETEYRLNILPLGGYVKMLGQEDFALKEGEETDPRAYNKRPIWARMCVVSAGVVMNVVLSALLFILVFSIGKEFAPAEIGSVTAGYPADQVKLPGDLGRGLKPGDVIEAINGKPIQKFDTIRVKGMLSGADETFRMTIRRPGVDEPFDVRLGTEQVVSPSGALGHAFGIGNGFDRVISDDPAYLTDLKQIAGGKLRGGDTIVAIAGEPIEHGWQVTQALDELPGDRPVEITVERKDPQTEAVTRHTAELTPWIGWSRQARRDFLARARQDDQQPPYKPTPFHILGLQPRMRVAAVVADGPAEKAGLKAGDVITGFGPGKKLPTLNQFNALCRDNAGDKVDIAVQRDGKPVADISAVEIKSRNGKAMIGIMSRYDQENLVVAGVRPDSPLAGQIPPGAVITAVNDQPVTTWATLLDAVDALDRAAVSLTYETAAGAEAKSDSIALAEFDFHRDYYAFAADAPTEPLQKLAKSSNPLEAISLGVSETGDFIVLTYATLRGFFSGRVSGKEFSGPIGIFRAGVHVGKRGPVWLIWLLAIISANLAVINFLPLPIVDGGLMVFLIIEKIRRKPLSVAVQNAVQVVGLIAIAVVFVLLTYNDIVQWVRSSWQ